jgi:hypothetical protein
METNILIISKCKYKQKLFQEIIYYLGYAPLIVSNGKKGLVYSQIEKISHVFFDEFDDYKPEIITQIIKKKGTKSIIHINNYNKYSNEKKFDYTLELISISNIKQILTSN